jgi:hypothetical protein
VMKLETWLKAQPEAKIVSSYIGGGAPRFFLAYNPELPDPNFAKMIILTPNSKERDKLILRLRGQVAASLAPEARRDRDGCWALNLQKLGELNSGWEADF